MLFFPFFNAALKYVIMPFFVPLCDAYAPVILPSFGPLMLSLGAYMLVVLLRLDLCSFFFAVLTKRPIPGSAVSLNVMLIPIHVFSRQTVLCLGARCVRPMIHPTPHTTRVNTWVREKRQTNVHRFMYDQGR